MKQKFDCQVVTTKADRKMMTYDMTAMYGDKLQKYGEVGRNPR